MRKLLVGLLVVVAACSSSDEKPVEIPRSTTTTVAAVDELPADVAGQLEPGDTATEIAPGVYKRASDGLLLGKCDAVEPYVAEHGKPDGSLCFE